MAKEKNKKKSAAKPAKKASKPVAKKSAKPAAKSKVKPAAKKPAKPIAKSKPVAKSKPSTKVVSKAKASVKAKVAPKAKPVSAKTTKPAVSKKEDKKKEKEIKKIAPISAKASKPEAKKAMPAVKPGKKSAKKGKAADGELEGEDLDMDDGLLEQGLEVEADVVEDDEDLLEVDEPRGKGRPSKKKPAQDKKSFDSEEFVRKQVVKIDLTKNLVRKSQHAQPKPYVNTSDTRTRYSDAELAEFKELILKKLEEAQADYDLLKQTLSHADDHGTDDTSPTFKLLEDGSDVLSKEETAQLAARQEKYIVSLKNALIRIENKSYGICRATGKLIPKQRLRSVPHATLSIDAKLNQNN